MPLDRQDPRRKRDPQTLVEEATLDFTMGDATSALYKIHDAILADENFFPAYHAMAEIYFAQRDLPMALASATKAHKLRPDDIHINTSLSRIYMELGDKPQAEHYGAQAKMLGWKEELKQPPSGK